MSGALCPHVSSLGSTCNKGSQLKQGQGSQRMPSITCLHKSSMLFQSICYSIPLQHLQLWSSRCSKHFLTLSRQLRGAGAHNDLARTTQVTVKLPTMEDHALRGADLRLCLTMHVTKL